MLNQNFLLDKTSMSASSFRVKTLWRFNLTFMLKKNLQILSKSNRTKAVKVVIHLQIPVEQKHTHNYEWITGIYKCHYHSSLHTENANLSIPLPHFRYIFKQTHIYFDPILCICSYKENDNNELLNVLFSVAPDSLILLYLDILILNVWHAQI